jgi:hypothetical protein
MGRAAPRRQYSRRKVPIARGTLPTSPAFEPRPPWEELLSLPRYPRKLIDWPCRLRLSPRRETLGENPRSRRAGFKQANSGAVLQGHVETRARGPQRYS